MPTITDLKAAKYSLENTILNAITEFEEALGVTVAFVGSTHSREMGGPEMTVKVSVEVRV